jgi:hypothetical protein
VHVVSTIEVSGTLMTQRARGPADAWPDPHPVPIAARLRESGRRAPWQRGRAV